MDEYKKILEKNSLLVNKRISLRPFSIEDASDLFEMASDDKVTKFLTWDGHSSIEQSKGTLNNRFIGNPAFYAIELRSENRCIGVIDIRIVPEHKKAEFGCMLNRNYRGNGYMTEALNLFLDLTFNKLKLNKMESTHYVGNEGSGRVMQKCGMKIEGMISQEFIIKNKFVDVVHYGITAKEFFTLNNVLND